MKNSLIHAAKSALFLLLVTGLFAACSNSTSSEEEEEQEPIAIRVKQNGQTVVERNNETNTTTGTLTVNQGTTTSFTVLFVDENGVEFTPEPDEHSIDVSSTSPIIIFSNVNSESAPFGFDVQAQDTGAATFQIVMNHVGSPEFTASGLPLEVTSSN